MPGAVAPFAPPLHATDSPPNNSPRTKFLAAQLPRDLLGPSSGLKELAQVIKKTGNCKAVFFVSVGLIQHWLLGDAMGERNNRHGSTHSPCRTRFTHKQAHHASIHLTWICYTKDKDDITDIASIQNDISGRQSVFPLSYHQIYLYQSAIPDYFHLLLTLSASASSICRLKAMASVLKTW